MPWFGVHVAAPDRQQPYRAAQRLYAEKRYAAALGAYEQLANEGDAHCQVFVGWMYHDGIGTRSDKERAHEWFLRAANLGSREGAFYCGKLAITLRKHEQARDWFSKAAATEYGPALLWLGLMSVRGLGREVDLTKGVEYLRRATRAGNLPARRELAVLMIKGKLGLLQIPRGILSFVATAAALLFVAIAEGQSEKLMG